MLDQVRELKDVNSRLFKLVSDKDFEIRRLKKRIEEDQIALSGTLAPIPLHGWYGMPGDVLISSLVQVEQGLLGTWQPPRSSSCPRRTESSVLRLSRKRPSPSKMPRKSKSLSKRYNQKSCKVKKKVM